MTTPTAPQETQSSNAKCFCAHTRPNHGENGCSSCDCPQFSNTDFQSWTALVAKPNGLPNVEVEHLSGQDRTDYFKSKGFNA